MKPRASFGSPATTVSRMFDTLRIGFLVDGGKGRPFSVSRVKMRPRAVHAPLWHAKTSEFFIVLQGDQWARIDGRRRYFKKGDFAFLPPGAVHEFRAGARGVEVLAVFSPAMDFQRPDIVTRRR